MTDVRVYSDSTLVGFQPVSDAAREWFAENVESEPWQWMGGVLWCDARPAQALVEGLAAEGFNLGN